MSIRKNQSHWNEMENYNVTRQDLKLLNLSFEELFELYIALKYPNKYHNTIEKTKDRILKIKSANIHN